MDHPMQHHRRLHGDFFIVGADQVASASVRVQASVMGLGQAAGCAAAQCACAGTSVHKADVHTLQAMLRKWGALI